MRILFLVLVAAVLSACTTTQTTAPTYPPGVKEAPKALVDDKGRPVRLLESFSDSIAAVLEKDGAWKIVSKNHPIKALKLRELSEFSAECYAAKFGEFWTVVVKKS